MGIPFTAETLTFLRGLARHNDREWFEARREIYERAVKAPMLSLIEEINAALIEFAPDHVRPAAKTMLRIYRDTRFSNNKLPYKTHVSAWFGRKATVHTKGAGFYLQVSPKEIVLAGGVYMPPPEHLLAVRRWMAENHEAYRKLLKAATRARKDGQAFEVEDTRSLTRIPKGFAPDHPADELLRARRWGVAASLGPEYALENGFAKIAIQRFRVLAPLVLALDEATGAGSSKAAESRRRAFF
jgi:uncharacterized protein (TIGR02453 family)